MSIKTSQFSIICLFYLIGCCSAVAEPSDTHNQTYKTPKITAPHPNNSPRINIEPRPVASKAPPLARQFMVRTGVPAKVYLEDSIIMVQAGNMQPLSLESVYWPLYQNWRNQYVRIGDFDKDGLLDIGVLQSVGHVGQDLCYSIYTYDQRQRQFRTERSFDRCNL